MKIKHALALGTLGIAALMVPGETAAVDAKYVANLATVAPEGTPWADQMVRLRDQVAEASNGEIKYKAFMGGAMGNEVEIVRDCRRGERLQGVGVSTGALAEGAKVPELALAELPYLFSSNLQADTVLDDVMFEPVTEALRAKGFEMVTWSENGWRSFGVKVKDGNIPTSPEALSAYKMRAQESPVHKNMYTAFGTQYVTTPTSEILPSLTTGIVDGFDNTPLFSTAAGLYGPIDHFVMSKHIYQPAAVILSSKWFKTLPPEIQTIVKGDARAEAKVARASIREMDAAMIGVMEGKGVTVLEIDDAQRAAFAAKAVPTHEEFLQANESVRPLYKKIQDKLSSM